MQPAQPFGRRGAAAAPPAQFGSRQTASPPPSQPPEPTLASLGLERLGSSAAASADRGMLWVLFGFRGRLSAGHYRLVRIVVNICAMVLVCALVAFAVRKPTSDDTGLALLVLLINCTAFPVWIWITLAMQIKRWHDRDKPGVFILVGFIPMIGPLWTLVELMFLEGTNGPNQFGAPPFGGTATDFEA